MRSRSSIKSISSQNSIKNQAPLSKKMEKAKSQLPARGNVVNVMSENTMMTMTSQSDKSSSEHTSYFMSSSTSKESEMQVRKYSAKFFSPFQNDTKFLE